jgi:hypothetical protein
MAPIDQESSISPSPKQKSASPDDGENWFDLTDSPTETKPYPNVPMQSTLAGPNGIGFNSDPIYRVAPTAQHTLEAELLHLAEVDLGLLNAIAILERHLVDRPEELDDMSELNRVLGRPVYTPFPHNHVYNNDRISANQMLKDIGYLMGLKKAVKFLQAALADPDRKDIKYKSKLPPLPHPGAISPPMHTPAMQVPCGTGVPYSLHQGPTMLPVQHVSPMPTQDPRVIAQDIVKQTVEECMDVQRETIKLLLDVCRDALRKKDRRDD